MKIYLSSQKRVDVDLFDEFDLMCNCNIQVRHRGNLLKGGTYKQRTKRFLQLGEIADFDLAINLRAFCNAKGIPVPMWQVYNTISSIRQKKIEEMRREGAMKITGRY